MRINTPVGSRPTDARASVYERMSLPIVLGVVLVLCLSALLVALPTSRPEGPSALISAGTPNPLPPIQGNNYPQYLDGNLRTGDAGNQSPINVSNVHLLHPIWRFPTGKAVWAQPIVANGVVYAGSSDGYEYALDATNGTLLWQTFLGTDRQDLTCGGGGPGVTSTPAFLDNRLYVSGGNSEFYALNATTGRIAWDLPIGPANATSMGYYLWASPLIFNQSAYVGISSLCDKPLVPAGLERISLRTHEEIAYFNSSVPNPNGSSIWGSPSLSEKTNTVFVTTGNPYQNLTSTYAESVIALNASTLAVRYYWSVPQSEVVGDGDFGVTPTLFHLLNGTPVVTAEDKNGYLYELYQSNLSLIWSDRLGYHDGDRFSTTFANNTLYAVSMSAQVNLVNYSASLTAINPKDGARVWQDLFNISTGPTYGAPLYVNGVLVFSLNTSLFAVNAATGAVLFQSAPGGTFTPPASVYGGEILAGDGNHLAAFDVPLELKATSSRAFGAAPRSVNFTAAPSAGLPGYAFNWSFGDGNFSSAMDPTHNYTMPGNYSVVVTVTDARGAVATHRFLITVTAAGRRGS
jgi:outer membrane protein assembly factor BamB